MFLILLLCIFSCQNSTEQVKKEAPSEKKEEDWRELRYKKYGDVDRYQR